MPGNNPSCLRSLHPSDSMWPLSHTWLGAKWAMEDFLSTQMESLGGPFRETLPKREFIINCSSWKNHHTKLYTKVKKTSPLQPNELQTLLSFLALQPYQALFFHSLGGNLKNN